MNKLDRTAFRVTISILWGKRPAERLRRRWGDNVSSDMCGLRMADEWTGFAADTIR